MLSIVFSDESAGHVAESIKQGLINQLTQQLDIYFANNPVCKYLDFIKKVMISAGTMRTITVARGLSFPANPAIDSYNDCVSHHDI